MGIKDIQHQKPFKTNQIENERPAIQRTTNILTGWIANSFNAGHNRTIHWKKIMAGERHKEYSLNLRIKLLTPKTPAYQNLKCCIRTYFVPNSRVWVDAEKYTAQKGGSTEEKILEIPNIGQTYNKAIQNETGTKWTRITNTTTWRDSWISSYISRVGLLEESETQLQNIPFAKESILKLRGRIAIFNDYERNKEYDYPLQESNGSSANMLEFRRYTPEYIGTDSENSPDKYFMRARRDDSYWTNYRTEAQGFESELPSGNTEGFDESAALTSWANWESKINEARQQSMNSQKNDWDIISEIRGSKKLSEGKVQLIGKNTFTLNYSSITQNAYNANENIDPQFQILGQQGAYSFTEAKVNLYAGMEFVEEGYIHVIATVTADTVFEQGIDRNELNITALDEYRPDLADDKLDVMYKCEMGTEYIENAEGYQEVIGFKRKYNEIFKLPNVITGDLCTNDYLGYIKYGAGGNTYVEQRVITQKTYQFFDPNPEKFITENGEILNKRIWLDYTDLYLNKNQAIQNEIIKYDDNNFFIGGHNQIDIVGVATCVAELPVSPDIASNYTKWGEH